MILRPRYVKILRDLRISYGRVGAMVVAIAVAVMGFGAILTAKEVITADAWSAYSSTNPAAATLDVHGGVDSAVLAQVRELEGVADATARQTISTRVQTDDQWLGMKLFVVSVADPLHVARFEVESGAWPVGSGELLVERPAAALLGIAQGDQLVVAGADGNPVSLTVSGLAYDAALPPAYQERTGYGFITPSIAESLGFEAVAEELKITVSDVATGAEKREQAVVDVTATRVADWLESEGHAVHGITAPPYRHPHQNQTDTVTNLLLAFALAALLLAGVLVASTLGGMLAAQARQIGVMKTLGATTGTVVRLYLSMILAVAALATAAAVAPGLWLGIGLANLVGGVLNIDIVSRSASALTVSLIVAAGIAVPTVVALSPVLRAARVTVLQALGELDVDHRAGAGRLGRLMSRAGGGDRIPVFAARNLLRRPRRFIAMVSLLGAGGALFLAGLNSAGAWERWVDDGLATRSYDAQLVFVEPASVEELAEVLAGVEAIAQLEGVATHQAIPAAIGDDLRVERVYPDGGHGGFGVTAIDPSTSTIDFDVRAGTWLSDGDAATVVLNQSALARVGDVRPGQTVAVWIEGVRYEWLLVGIVDEIGGPATAYVPTGTLDALVGDGMTTGIRIVVHGDESAGIGEAESVLSSAGMTVASAMPTSEFEKAIDEHVVVFIAVLIALAVLMAVIGVLGLASSMTISVIERSREHGIMKAIGAGPGVIRRLVLSEGVITGIVGFMIATAVSVPLSALVGEVLGRLSFDLPLPLVISAPGIAVWAAIAVVGAALASLSAAQSAAGLTIRESLSRQ